MIPAGIRHAIKREWRRVRVRKGLRRRVIRRITTDRELLQEMRQLEWGMTI